MNKIILSFNNEQLKIINEALLAMPYKYAAPLINDINTQIQKSFDEKVDKEERKTGETKDYDPFRGD